MCSNQSRSSPSQYISSQCVWSRNSHSYMGEAASIGSRTVEREDRELVISQMDEVDEVAVLV